MHTLIRFIDAFVELDWGVAAGDFALAYRWTHERDNEQGQSSI